MKTCPYCAEDIPGTAVTCPYCNMDPNQPPQSAPARSSQPPRSSGSYIWIILLAVGGGAMLLVVPCLIALLLPAVQQAREAARRSQCRNNLKQIGLALHNYHDTYGAFPPAYLADEHGRPMHSWRVLLLPYLERSDLYEAYDFSQPWDSPANRFVLEDRPLMFACPSHPHAEGSTNTHYAAVSGPDTILEGSEPVGIRDITDGTSNTLMVGEVAGAEIPWTSPQDVDVSLHPGLGDAQGFSSHHAGGVQFLMADGSVRFISENIFPDTLMNLFLRNDGNPVAEF